MGMNETRARELLTTARMRQAVVRPTTISVSPDELEELASAWLLAKDTSNRTFIDAVGTRFPKATVAVGPAIDQPAPRRA